MLAADRFERAHARGEWPIWSGCHMVRVGGACGWVLGAVFSMYTGGGYESAAQMHGFLSVWHIRRGMHEAWGAAHPATMYGCIWRKRKMAE